MDNDITDENINDITDDNIDQNNEDQIADFQSEDVHDETHLLFDVQIVSQDIVPQVP
jgi:hypothetical protein